MKLYLILILSLAFGIANAQYQLEKSTFGNSSGKTEDGSYVVQSTTGQALIGKSTGTGYEVQSGFWYGYMPPPPSHPSSFYISGNNKTALNITFDSPATTNNEKYLVLYRTGSELTGVPQDGFNYNVGDDIGDSKVGGIITDASATTFTLTGLTMETTYTLRLVPFSGTGGSVDYLGTGDPATLTATTIPTMGQWALIGFIGIVGLVGWMLIRKRFA